MKKLMLSAVVIAALSASLASCTSDEPAAAMPAGGISETATESVTVTAALPAGIKSRTAEGQFLGDGKEVDHFVWALYDAASGAVVESGEENCTAGQGSFSFKFQAVPGVQFKLLACAYKAGSHNVNLVSHDIARQRGTLYDTLNDNADIFLHFSDAFSSAEINGTMNISLIRPFVQVVLVSKSVDAIPDETKAKNLSTSVAALDRSGQVYKYNFWEDTCNGDQYDWPVTLELDATKVLPVKGFEDYQLISYGNFFTPKDPNKSKGLQAGIKWSVTGSDKVTYYSGAVNFSDELIAKVKQNTRIVITDANGGIFTDRVNVSATVSPEFGDENTTL